jgi:hypothetical protein
LPNGPGCRLDILLADRAGHIHRREAQIGQLAGVEPDAHGIRARAEEEHLANAGNPSQHIADVEVGIVAEEHVIITTIGRDQIDRQRKVGGLLGDADALLDDFRRQLRQGVLSAILHVLSGEVEIIADLEGHGDACTAAVAAAGRHIQHALYPVDLLLERGSDCALDDLGTGARVEGADLDGGGGDRRELGHR